MRNDLILQQRVRRLREKLKRESYNAIFISNFYNIFYLTGFKTLTTDEREAFVLVTSSNVYLFTDARYLSAPQSSFELRLIEPHHGVLQHLEEIIKKEKIEKLGFEGEDLKYFEYQRLTMTAKNTSLHPLPHLLVKEREIKDASEIKKIERACDVTGQCLNDMVKIIREGITEKEIAFKTELWLKSNGYDLAFYPIVAVDSNSAIPHYDTRSGNGIVAKSSLILIDFGAKFEDYLSDITRVFFVGEPTKEQRFAYQTLLAAQEKTVELISKNKDPKTIDTACRNMITEANLPDYSHSTGHGVGLEIHEYPKISFNSQDSVLEQQVFTIEPGIYLPGKFGLRIEDTVAIEKGQAKILTKFPKTMQIF